MDELLTVEQAAAIKKVSESAIYRAIDRGEIPSEKKYGRILLKPADVDAYQPGSYRVERTHRRRGPVKKTA